MITPLNHVSRHARDFARQQPGIERREKNNMRAIKGYHLSTQRYHNNKLMMILFLKVESFLDTPLKQFPRGPEATFDTTCLVC